MDNEKILKIDAKEFKKRRIALNISQNNFANIAGISYRTIIRFEHGESINCTSVDKIVHTLEMLESKPKNENLWWKSHKNSFPGKPQA